MKNIFLYILIALSIHCSTTLQFRKEMFITRRNNDIGKYIDNILLPDPIQIIKIDEYQSKYIYEYTKTKCQWFYIIRNDTNEIISWDYISDPDLCYHELTIRQ